MSRIRRSSAVNSIAIDNSAALSAAFSMEGASGGIVQMPAAWTSASLGFKVSDTSTGTFIPLYDDDGVLVQIDSPGASKAYSLPPELFGALHVKAWSQNGSGSNTVQTAARTLTVTLKA